ncbi:MAG: hypothetical protein EHM89_15950 [Acidobacteria bacterium]|nr:MAG: hypothetical protein EHM89_15950 [Acidobacteriota bacterium]
MPDLFGAGWYTAELRSSAGWDRAFKTAAAGDQDVVFAAGVVIHSIADVGVAEDGPGWPKDNRVCYEGTIPVPSTGNDDWTNGLFSARVTGPKGSGLLVGRTLPPLEAVRLEVMGSMPTTTTVPGPSTEAVLIGPSCGKGTLETELHTTTLHITGIAAANGFLAPAFRFTLNDQPIGAWARVIVPVLQSSITPVTVRLERPVAYDERITQTAVVMITWQIQGNRLVLEIPGGDGRFTLTVGVSVGDATLPNPIPRATAVETFDLVTAGIGLTESSREAVQQCASYLGSWRLAQPIGPEDPLPPIALPDDWTSLDRESLVHALGNLQTLIETNARVATDVVADIGSQLGVRPATLMQAMRRLPREPHG